MEVKSAESDSVPITFVSVTRWIGEDCVVFSGL